MKKTTSALLIILAACTSQIEYKYFESYKSYMAEVHNIDINKAENTIFYMVNIECETCINNNLETIAKLPENDKIRIVFVGKNNDSLLDQTILKIKQTYYYNEDSEKLSFGYELGMKKSLIVHVLNGKCNYAKSPDDFELEEIHNKIAALLH